MPFHDGLGEGQQPKVLTSIKSEETIMSGKIPKERERYFVRLDSGEVCEVSREVYLCYYAGERQERYQRERDIKNGLVSIEAMAETMFDDGEGCGYDFIPSDEVSIAEQVVRDMMIEKLYIALDQLAPEDRQLITALFFDNVSLRCYARENGVTHRTVQKWRDRILEDLRKMMS